MNGGALLGQVAATLDAAGIPFMLTGSVAAAFHGAPRTTLDIDLVIDASESQLRMAVAEFLRAGLYVSEAAALEAHALGGMFNIIDSSSGWKVDLIHCKARPFSRAEFARRTATVLDGVPVAVATLEDVILSKLEWARLGESPRQLSDVAMLLAMRATELDRDYLERWIGALGVAPQWEEASRMAGRIGGS